MRSGPDERSRGRGNDRPSRPRPPAPQNNQTLVSNGGGERIRGTAPQIFERYFVLAREAARNDDRVASENYYQHAEHYFRLNNAGGDGNSPGRPRQADLGLGEPRGAPREPDRIGVDGEQP